MNGQGSGLHVGRRVRSTSFDLGQGSVPATAFLVDMNRLFEDFLFQALRDELGSVSGEWVQGSRRHALYLDEGKTVTLQPDLSLWAGSQCLWLGDAKYKRVTTNEYSNADLYQVTAYAIATDLDRATLVYAKSEGPGATHRIVHVGKIIDAIAIDLSATPTQLLTEIATIAETIRIAASGSGGAAA